MSKQTYFGKEFLLYANPINTSPITTGATSQHVVGFCSEVSININKSTIETTHLGSGNWKEFVADILDYDLSINSLLTRPDAGGVSFKDFLTNMINSDEAFGWRCQLKIPEVGTIILYGNCLTNGLSLKIGATGLATYSGKAQGSGQIYVDEV